MPKNNVSNDENQKLKALLSESVTIIKDLQKENEQLKERNKQLSQDLQDTQLRTGLALEKRDEILKQKTHFDSEKPKNLQERIKEFQARHKRLDSKLSVGEYDGQTGKWKTK